MSTICHNAPCGAWQAVGESSLSKRKATRVIRSRGVRHADGCVPLAVGCSREERVGLRFLPRFPSIRSTRLSFSAQKAQRVLADPLFDPFHSRHALLLGETRMRAAIMYGLREQPVRPRDRRTLYPARGRAQRAHDVSRRLSWNVCSAQTGRTVAQPGMAADRGWAVWCVVVAQNGLDIALHVLHSTLHPRTLSLVDGLILSSPV